MRPTPWLLFWALDSALATSSSAQQPVAQACPGYQTPTVVCINNHAAVLPLPFFRSSPPGNLAAALPDDSFNSTSVPGDASFSLVHEASFVVFDTARGSALLGPSPVLETVFDNLGSAVHEAPAYVPALNSIIVSRLSADTVPQILINLTATPPIKSDFVPSPPIYGVNGARYYNGTVYWAAVGSNFTFDSKQYLQTPGIYALDPLTREAKPILNNYFGQAFNSPDDLAIDPDTGDIFFTDPFYGFALNFTTALPVLKAQTYRFRPSTGAVSVVEADIACPNGVAISPDGRTLYITDTEAAKIDFAIATLPRYEIKAREPKAVYAFDLVWTPAGKVLANKRALWYPEQLIDDGFHVAADGTLLGAAGYRYVGFSLFRDGLRGGPTARVNR